MGWIPELYFCGLSSPQKPPRLPAAGSPRGRLCRRGDARGEGGHLLHRGVEKRAVAAQFQNFVEHAVVPKRGQTITGRSGPKKSIPYPVAFVFAAISQTWAKLTRGQTRVSLEAVRMLHAQLAVTSAKAEQELGWKHRRLRETLADEVAWYRARGLAAELAAPAAAVAA